MRLTILLLAGAWLLSCQPSPYQQGLEKRKEMLRVWADSCQQQNFFAAASRILHNKQREQGIRQMQAELESYRNQPVGMFHFYQIMLGYLFSQEYLPTTLKNQVRDFMATANFYRGDTENHLMIYYTGLYLAAQTWPDLGAEKWFTGKSAAENMAEAKGWLEYWIDITARIGQGEFDSPTYMPVYLSSLIGLQQLTTDKVFKNKIEKMVLWLLADYAVEHLDGMYTGAHSREYPDRLILKRHPSSDMNHWGWLLFGQVEKPMFHMILLPLSLGDFHIPDIINTIATERNTPYVHTETKRVRNVLRLGSRKRNPLVYKMTYMTKDFALGSMMGGQILQPIQQHTWDVTYVSASPYSTIFTVHPYVGYDDLGMFFPEEMRYSTEQVVKSHTYYGSPNKWSSSSPYEQTFQYKDAIIVLYHIPNGVQFPHIDGFFPKDLEIERDQPNGWIFTQAGNSYIAYFPLKPYQWILEEHGYRLRSHALKNGCVVQISQAEKFDSFLQFKQRMRETNVVFDTFEETLTASYTTLEGVSMTFTYDGARLLDGKPVNFEDYGQFKGPFLNSRLGEKKLTLTARGKHMVLDLRD